MTETRRRGGAVVARGKAVASFFPQTHNEQWWIAVSELATKQLHAVRRVTVQRRLATKRAFTLPKGRHELRLLAICDSVVGADQELDIQPLDVAEAEESNDDLGKDDAMSE
ncbi:Pre-mRNA-splicing helicase BRR2 [Rhodotorula kratochvilovae]